MNKQNGDRGKRPDDRSEPTHAPESVDEAHERITAFDWTVRADKVPGRGLRFCQVATPDQRDAFAAQAQVPGCDHVSCELEIVRNGGGFSVEGEVRARLTLACGVTLDPVPQEIIEQVSVEFRHDAGSIARDPNTDLDFDALEADDPEPILAGVLDIGAYVGDVIVTEIDLFPRAPDADMDQTEAGQGSVDEAVSPFAALAQLRSGAHSDDGT